MTTLRAIESPVAAEIVLDGRRFVNFGGSSYLGLAGNTQLQEAGISALRTHGSGYQLARHYQIATRAHREAEREAAAFFDRESALYLAAGYYFGFVALAALRETFNVVFFDELSHHCLREAIAASGLASYAFRHLDADDLHTKLKGCLRAGDRPLICSDGLYSTFGRIAPLADFARAIEPYGGRLLVDESHSFGVLGARGRGACEHHGIPASEAITGGSTGKAFGVLGGIIPASADEEAAFRRAPAARSASAGLPAAAAMCAASFKYVREHPELLARLRANTAYLKQGMRGIGLDVGDDTVPVATFVTPGRSMSMLQEQLMSDGIYVLHSNYIGTERTGVIRCAIFADHTIEHMSLLLDALRRRL